MASVPKLLPPEAELRLAFAAAWEEARRALEADEVPVGAVIVKNGEVIARAANSVVHRHDPTAHAELLVIREAARVIGNERLIDCHMYSTLEPCTMCSGALIQARLGSVHFLALEKKIPAFRNVIAQSGHNHYPSWHFHNLPEWPAGELLQNFFREKRRLQKEQRVKKNIPRPE